MAIIRVIFLSAFLLGISSYHAQAGFTLLPGENNGQTSSVAPPPITSSIVPENSVKPLAASPQNLVNTPAAPMAITSDYSEPPPIMIPGPAPAMPQPALTATTAKSMPLSTPKVVGFGKRVPLVIALKELAPNGTQQAFAKDVNPRTLIDWQGGKDWLTTLNDSLAPKGLKANYNNQTVFIESTQEKPISASLDNNVVVITPAMPPPVLPPALTAPANSVATVTTTSTTVAEPAVKPLSSPTPIAPIAIPAPVQMVAATPLPPAEMPAAVTTTTQTVVVAPPAVQANQEQQWSASKGTTLRHTLEEWTARQGTELVWDTEYDFPVQASININGDFENAIRTLLRGFNQATPQPVATLHKATAEAGAVLVVGARGNDYGGGS